MIQTIDTKTAAEKHPERRLKVEGCGDIWKGQIKPKIRLTGRWLERAGFVPGYCVTVTSVAPGLLELRFCGESKGIP